MPKGVTKAPEAHTDTDMAPASGLMPAAWHSMMAMGSTRTVAEEFIRNWVVSSIRKVMAPSRMMGGRLLSTGLMALTRYSAAPLLTRALLRGKIPPTMKMVEVGKALMASSRLMQPVTTTRIAPMTPAMCMGTMLVA